MTESEFFSLTEDRDELASRDWPPHHEIPLHNHPFALKALVTRGLMKLSVDGLERTLHPGDFFELSLGRPHAERYGPDGATYLVAIYREDRAVQS
jgi:quercetin dioxygenase-like cupin family protein